MVAVAFLATVAVVSGLAYTKTMQALVLAKSRGISARLAQDKFETLRGLSYQSLIITSQEDLDITPPGADQTNYPPETIDMGGKTFTRLTTVSRVYKDSSGNVTVLAPSAADTGLKQVKVVVQYVQGADTLSKTYTILVSDPELIPLDATLYGTITDSLGAAVPNAKVFITQNQNWYALSSSTGYYQIQMDTRTYTATVVKAGYWDKESASVTPLGPTGLSIQITAKQTGRVTGLTTYRPRNLRISGIHAGSVALPDEEFLELYNPTTAAFLITSDGTNANANIKIIRIGASGIVHNDLTFTASTARSVPAEGYFLLALSSPTVNGVIPDAILTVPGITLVRDAGKGGVAIQDLFGVVMDSVGWTNNLADPGPNAGIETSGVYVGGGGNFGSGGFIVRKSSPSGVTLGAGNSYDSNTNSFDMLLDASVAAGYPRNSLSAAAPVVFGAVAASATVTATDGFSAAVRSDATGYYLMDSITTGTWTAATFYSSFTLSTGGLNVTNGGTTTRDLLLESTGGGQGGISGRVTRSDTLAAVSGISIAAGTSNTLTDASGNYVLSLTSGSYSVVANDGYASLSYGTLTSTAAAPSGGVTTGLNFDLLPAGVVTGKVTTNGVDSYAAISVHAVYQGHEIATDITNSAGNYTLYGVPVGSNIIEPLLDTDTQSASPASITLSVTQGTTHAANDFTVTSSMGKIVGALTSGGKPITTGALIVASTTTLASLPTVDSAYSSGANVLYSNVSDTAGNYTLYLVKNSTYNVYAYYTALGSNETTNTTAITASIYVSSTVTRNFAW